MTVFYTIGDTDFPFGVRCIDCKRELTAGMVYTTRPEGMTQAGSFIEELVCVGCASTQL